MLIVVAVGGNALLRRGEPLDLETQRANAGIACDAIAALINEGHEVVLTHGNGPQVGLLALQAAAFHDVEAYPLDVLDAESEGMIGYLLAQGLQNRLGKAAVATVLTQVEVDPDDPAFQDPNKPIGPVYSRSVASRIANENGWTMASDGDGVRRVVPSPKPVAIVELEAIRGLVANGVIVICAGGGGIPVVRSAAGQLRGIEAVVDKDRVAALLAERLGADALLLLTDIDGVYSNWGLPGQQLIRSATPTELMRRSFAAGSMAPKVEAAVSFASIQGRIAGIGALQDAVAILRGERGTTVAYRLPAPAQN
jgi:carbamate kinase